MAQFKLGTNYLQHKCTVNGNEYKNINVNLNIDVNAIVNDIKLENVNNFKHKRQ